MGKAQDPVQAVQSLQDENQQLRKQIEGLLKEKAKGLKKDLQQAVEEVNGVQFLAQEVDLNGAGMKDLAFELGQEVDNLFLVLGSKQDGKALLACYISKDLAAEKDLHAGKIVKELGRFIQGGGGGQPFFATAGGKNPDGIAEALSKSADWLK